SFFCQAEDGIRDDLVTGVQTCARPIYLGPSIYFYSRATTGGTTASQRNAVNGLPYWVKLVRSGNTFSGYASADGVNWAQVGSSQDRKSVVEGKRGETRARRHNKRHTDA